MIVSIDAPSLGIVYEVWKNGKPVRDETGAVLYFYTIKDAETYDRS